MLFGTLATFLAAVSTYQLRHIRFKGVPFLSCLPPILFNAVIVGAEITYIFMPETASVPVLLFNMVTVGLGQVVSCGILGLLLVKPLKKRRSFAAGLRQINENHHCFMGLERHSDERCSLVLRTAESSAYTARLRPRWAGWMPIAVYSAFPLNSIIRMPALIFLVIPIRSWHRNMRFFTHHAVKAARCSRTRRQFCVNCRRWGFISLFCRLPNRKRWSNKWPLRAARIF